MASITGLSPLAPQRVDDRQHMKEETLLGSIFVLACFSLFIAGMRRLGAGLPEQRLIGESAGPAG